MPEWEWGRHVLEELKRLNGCYEKLDGDFDEKIDKLRTEFSTQITNLRTDFNTKYDALNLAILKLSNENSELKVKAGIWGGLGAAIPVAIGLLIYLMNRKP